jgi:hypothetical protein
MNNCMEKAVGNQSALLHTQNKANQKHFPNQNG